MKPTAVVQEQIISEMAGLHDPLSQYQYLITQARALQVPCNIRSDENTLPGCQVSVWLKAEMEDDRLRLLADTDAMIIRGLTALLLRVLDNRTPAEVVEADLYFLDRTGLCTHMSPARANGLAALVEQIRALGKRYGG